METNFARLLETSRRYFDLLGAAPVDAPPASDMVDKLLAQHANLRDLAAVIDQELASLDVPHETDFTVLEDALVYLTDYNDRYHHPVENMAIERLAHHSVLTGQVAERLEAQHIQLAVAATAFHDTLGAALAGSPLPREHLQRAGRRYLRLLEANMALEEAALLPVARTHLDSHHWQLLLGTLRVPADPLFAHAPESRFAHLRERLDQPAAAVQAA